LHQELAMHDLDRTLAPFGTPANPALAGEYEYEYEYGHGGYGGQGEQAYEFSFETADTARAPGGVFNETEEMELAAELLSVSDEAELEQFIGNLFKKASRAVGKFMKSDTAKQLGGLVKGAIKTALPIATGALGATVGIPPGLGAQAGAIGGQLLGLELEGLSPEDQEFEVAKQLVRLGGDAVRHAATTPMGTDATTIARQATAAAAQVHAPGLLRPVAPTATPPAVVRDHRGTTSSGRWVRRGNSIVLLGL
jgi:hypothetical protein